MHEKNKPTLRTQLFRKKTYQKRKNQKITLSNFGLIYEYSWKIISYKDKVKEKDHLFQN